MTTSAFLKEHKSKLKSVKSLNVRDLDEIKKNTFVAYVDQGNVSYDVQVILDSKKHIKDHNCDCSEGGVCHHIVALVQFIFENKSEKPIVKRVNKRKLSETDLILQEISNDELRNWISEILNKNKELAFAFKSNFTKDEVSFDQENLKKIINESITSIIGKRKKVENSEVKKIADLLKSTLKPYISYIATGTIDSKKYSLFITLTEQLQNFHNNYYLNSVRIIRIIDNVIDEICKNIFNIKDKEVWSSQIDFYFSKLTEDNYYYVEYNLCKRLYDLSDANLTQKNEIALVVEKIFQTLIHKNKGRNHLNFDLNNFILELFIENNIFERNYANFNPFIYQNDFNIKLIKELTKINKLALAESMALKLIEYNKRESFDLPYVDILIDIYKLTEEDQKLAKLLSIYGKYIFEFEYYLYIKNNTTIEVFKKYRQGVMSNARYAYQSGNRKAFDFYFEIKKDNNKSSDLLKMLNESNNIEWYNDYKEIALLINEIEFIKVLLSFSTYYNYEEKTEDEIVNFVCQKIEHTKLAFYLKNINPYYKNSIYRKFEVYLNQTK